MLVSINLNYVHELLCNKKDTLLTTVNSFIIFYGGVIRVFFVLFNLLIFRLCRGEWRKKQRPARNLGRKTGYKKK
jgi:hypothetical protein